MKSKILGSLIVAAGLLTVTSCEDYFDDVPNNATSLEDVFSNRGQALGWLTNLYSITPDNTNRYAGGTAMYWGPATIEGYLPWDWVETHDIIQGTMYSSTSWVERIWSNYYRGIQNANIYLAQQLNGVATTEARLLTLLFSPAISRLCLTMLLKVRLLFHLLVTR